MRAVHLRSLLGASLVVGVFVACGSNSSDDGDGSVTDDGGIESSAFIDSAAPNGCQPKTCADLGADCGPQADGCGAIIQCGSCASPAFCGGGGSSKCGTGAGDASVACAPKVCADLGAECGPQGDGCGGIVQCGTCATPTFCGGNGPSKCGIGSSDGGSGSGDAASLCQPKTCAELGKNCGPVADGCGGLAQCGTCPSGEMCGLKSPSVCAGTLADGGIACTPKTCADFGATCGQLGDGCGGLTAPCGTCSSPQFCGGGGYSKCGAGDAGTNDAGCTGLCQQIPSCSGGATTTLTGTVWAPSGPNSVYGALPVPGAVVYVPNGTVQAFTPGVSCDQCSALASGLPLVSTVTSADGTFTLKNVPAGANIPLVIQLGRWRRKVTIASVTPCVSQALQGDVTRLPRTQAEGDIPLIAVSTGNVDALECVFRKMGVDDSEFTNPLLNGRIRLYRDNGARAAHTKNQQVPTASDLYGAQTELDKFDAVLFACVGAREDKASADKGRVLAYANKGGRVFATHYSYVWLYDLAPWNTTAAWSADQDFWDSVTGLVDTGSAKGQQFATWLGVVNALSGSSPPRISIDEARHDVDQPVTAGAERWITTYQDDPKAALEHYAFNTPWGTAPASQCGRVIYSDFHVTTNSQTGRDTFPDECDSNPLTPQEKVLAYMMFDLTTCISQATPPPPATCTPKTCGQLGYGCGKAGDGCGGIIDCGACTAPQTCGGGGTPFQCGGSSPACTPKTCAQLGYNCGQAGDGCGGTLSCGTCTAPAYCGGSGPNQCGTSGVGSCTPTTCQAKGATCGPLGDGCGNLLSCGTCPANSVCIDNACVSGACTPISCASAGAQCGPLGDGCGGIVDCGTCPSGQACGGAGVSNQCGGGIIK